MRLEPDASFSAGKYPIIGTGPSGNKNNRNKSAQKTLASLGLGQPAAAVASGASSNGSRKPPKPFKQNGYGKNGNKGGQSRMTTTSTSSTTSTTSSTTTTTPRPLFSLSNYNRYTPAERTRTYNLSEYLASLKSPSSIVVAMTTIRPPSRSQIANIVVDSPYGPANNLLKLSVKAAKQVKPNQLQVQTTAKPNIPIKFQSYEKVQEFYPEFQVFEARSSAQPPLANERQSSGVGGGGGGGVYSGVLSSSFAQNGKPSRENAKKQFFTASHGQSNVGKKNSSQIVLVRSPDVRSHSNRTG